MKLDVAANLLFALVAGIGRVHCGQCLGESLAILLIVTFGRQLGGATLYHRPKLDQVRLESRMLLGHVHPDLSHAMFGSIHRVGAIATPTRQHAARDQDRGCFPNRGPGDTELGRQVSLGGDALVGREPAAEQGPFEVADDLLNLAFHGDVAAVRLV